MFCRNIFYIWNCVWMVTDVFTGVASLPLAKHIYNPPWARTLTFLRLQEGVSTVMYSSRNHSLFTYMSVMFRRLQERVFVTRKNSNSPRGLEFLVNGYNINTTLSFGKRSTRLGKTNWYVQILWWVYTMQYNTTKQPAAGEIFLRV